MPSVLAVAVAGMGNAILATPAVELLSRAGVDVSVLASKERSTQVAFLGWPDVVKDVFYDTDSYPDEYDYVFWTHPNWGLDTNLFGTYLEMSFPRHTEGIEYRWKFDEHETIALAKYIMREFDLEGDIPQPRVFSNPGSVELDVENPVAISVGYVKDNPKWAAKHWGNKNYIELLELLHNEGGFTPILLGNREDYERDGEEILEGCPFAINMCGTTELETVIAVLSKCMGYIGNDSGLMHCSAVQDKLTLGLFFANGSSPVKNHPYGKRGHWVWREKDSLFAPEVFEIWRDVLEGSAEYREMEVGG